MNDYHFSEIELQRRRNAEISDGVDMDENSSQFLPNLGARVKKAFWAKMARIIDSAVVGCGRMGCTTSDLVKKISPKYFFPLSHADAINQHENLNLKALCDTNNEILNNVANHFKVKSKFLDFNKMLQDINPELITVATRTNVRSQIIHKAFDNGVKAMHVEKPLCNSKMLIF